MDKTINSHFKKKFLANIHKLEMKYAVNKHFHVKSPKAMYPEQCKERQPIKSEDLRTLRLTGTPSHLILK